MNTPFYLDPRSEGLPVSRSVSLLVPIFLRISSLLFLILHMELVVHKTLKTDEARFFKKKSVWPKLRLLDFHLPCAIPTLLLLGASTSPTPTYFWGEPGPTILLVMAYRRPCIVQQALGEQNFFITHFFISSSVAKLSA